MGILSQEVILYPQDTSLILIAPQNVPEVCTAVPTLALNYPIHLKVNC